MAENGTATVSAPPSGAPGQSSQAATSVITPQYMGRDSSERSTTQKAETKEQSNGKAQTEANKREPSRYERTKRQRQDLQQQRAQFDAERAEFARLKSEFEEAKKPKRAYSLQELQQYRAEWQNEGRYDLVEAADRELAAMQKEEQAKFQTHQLPVRGTPEHKQQWESAEKELAQADPEFMRQGTRLDGVLREIFQSSDGDIYRQHPRGIIAAYHRAKMLILEQDLNTVRQENEQLQTELKKFRGYTSIGGGTTGSKPGGSQVETLGDFARLSRNDMRKHLMSNVGRGEFI
jgi:hypothetical protein